MANNRTYDRFIFMVRYTTQVEETYSSEMGEVVRTGRFRPVETIEHHIADWFHGVNDLAAVIMARHKDSVTGDIEIEPMFGIDGEVLVRYK